MIAPPGWSKRYPPLIMMVAALVLALFTLPSALNLPLANPGQTLEYAPVPGNGNSQSGGNFSGLGLGEGGSAQGGGGLPLPLPSNDVGPSNKICVGDPPRQTEDPLSPPCVAFFKAGNGGSTYRGVSATEIRVIYFVTCNGRSYLSTGDGQETPVCGTRVDLGRPAQAGEQVIPRVLRAYQAYFNQRYQMYNRRLHIYVHYGRDEGESSTSTGQSTSADRRADAADDIAQINPFAEASVDFVTQGLEDPYIDAMAQKGVLNFGSFADHALSFYSAYPKLIWSYLPAAELQSKQFSSYVCQKVWPYRASFGNPTDLNKPRVLGLMTNSDPAFPELTQFGNFVRSDIQACGGQFLAEHHYLSPGVATCSGIGNTEPSDMSDFRSKGVTTIIWAQGLEQRHGCAGSAAGYDPEVVFAGDGNIEDFAAERYGSPAALRNSVVVSNVTFTGRYDQEICGQAALEANPNFLPGDLPWACGIYPTIRQIATGIQVAGPHLTADSVDQGFHAIPPHASSDPRTPACFYGSGDYSCVKDAEAMFWDPSGTAPTAGGAGCWRVIDLGRRYLPGQWPAGDVTAQKQASDPCNGYATGLYPNPAS